MNTKAEAPPGTYREAVKTAHETAKKLSFVSIANTADAGHRARVQSHRLAVAAVRQEAANQGLFGNNQFVSEALDGLIIPHVRYAPDQTASYDSRLTQALTDFDTFYLRHGTIRTPAGRGAYNRLVHGVDYASADATDSERREILVEKLRSVGLEAAVSNEIDLATGAVKIEIGETLYPTNLTPSEDLTPKYPAAAGWVSPYAVLLDI